MCPPKKKKKKNVTDHAGTFYLPAQALVPKLAIVGASGNTNSCSADLGMLQTKKIHSSAPQLLVLAPHPLFLCPCDSLRAASQRPDLLLTGPPREKTV